MITKPAERPTLRIRDPFLFLFGVAPSIRRVLRCPSSLFLALALVATAAIAREYDAVSWLHRPQELLGPFVASLVFGSILFVFVLACLGSIGRKSRSVVRDYRLFMTGYWMTAPLAWLYAMPIETMTDEVTAIRFNLTMLSIVSIWRMLLFTRVVAIQFGIPMLAVLPWIVTPCMVIAFVSLLSRMLSMVSIMGGIRLTQTQRILSDYQGGVAATCFYGIIPMLLYGLVAIPLVRSGWGRKHQIGKSSVMLDRRVWGWPIFAAIVLLAGASQFQPKLYRAAEIDELLRADNVVEAIETMQQLGENALPRVWDPPPKFPDRDSQRPLISVLTSAITKTECDRWIFDRLLAQADEIALRQADWFQGTSNLSYLQRAFANSSLEQIEQALENLRELQAIGVGDAKTLDHRKKMIEVIESVREEAILIRAKVISKN